ncbi:conserved Plasmodium protein, unknown function [Plasmodium reichenowi]|uniref:Uncharacterized protein n=13 Tax=Plasmodium (Laverania) TaxID=418107 RepID=Q8IBZ4_PLAF7|nr:conserved Plasmodium protein, unknown function [Plasmodium falciparum 3D7]XP_012762192.1 hypothetical protein PRSY57_0707700 [Plasmodium reichenowi]ETW19495.1 hypothetical protein PFFVO_01676 [Plasmodium falciparum Vietnam Oak-Knoll (FVO)]ETW37575.1 hypothetical protein PFTANZ_01761 [Plasmodium falciparum Tanzania (2000708)]ETW43870.1 hypothetical protein PFNF135_01804 [Plasmodium falciparum NF135/5.C10]ETW50288.1 hypothetical protein PFMALIP_01710 [Plasmodium falciparum MaliPS096_E11]EUR7|eukprot:XP_001349009.1 conserved Plasmodium protein, unknown function [Plasmodium falciparum 3D7]
MDNMDEENNFNFPESSEVNYNEEFAQIKVGQLISEKYLADFINKDIFFIGEIMNIEGNVINVKSVNGNYVDCILKDNNFNTDSKYIGIKGIVSDDLKIIETRGIVLLQDINFEIVNDYINISMENKDSDVFIPSY